MKTLNLPNRAVLLTGACAGLALVAMGFADSAHARDNVTFSISVGGPNVLVGATNAYPVYRQPRPVYVQPAVVYYQQAPVYYQAQPVYYGRSQGWKRGHYKKHHKHGGYDQGYYNQGYAPVYYQR